MNGLGIVKMPLPSTLYLMLPDAVKGHIHLKAQRVERLGMARHIVRRQLLHPDASHTAYGICKIFPDKFFL